ncbi:MAG: DUF423 domain-containing protein [Candidatus Marinimicrobia bacterium]|nr:DUF423 domain-containing protein [Candidatus Neomarinimicrobiota bacterium]
MSVYFFAFMGAILGGLTVALGAFGAHALKPYLEAWDNSYGLIIWDKAVFYQAMHSIALLSLPLFSKIMSPKALNITGYMFIAGVLLFSGSLYVLALSGIKILGAITPIGGTAFVIGWIVLAFSLYKEAFRS